MILASQLRNDIIRPVLDTMQLYSPAAENLLMGTAAQESHLGSYIRQLDNGPALGIYQMEPATHDDIVKNYLAYRPELRAKVALWMIGGPGIKQLIGNLYYATAMCRIHYLRVSERLPDAEDVPGLALYWKAHYNTSLGMGTEAEFIKNYGRTR